MKNKFKNCSELVRFGGDNGSFNEHETFNVYNSHGNIVWANLDSLAKAESLVRDQINNDYDHYDITEEYTVIQTVLRHTVVKKIK
jgi:hypothetical protein